MLNRGWAPLSGVRPRSRKVHRSADRRALRPRGRSRRRRRTLRAARRHRTGRWRRVSPPSRLRHPDSGSRKIPTRRRDSDRSATSRAARPPKRAIRREDDPKHLVELDRTIHDAVEAFGAGRPADAVRLYQGVIERRPDMAIAYRHLAFVEARRGNAAAAIDVLQRAIADRRHRRPADRAAGRDARRRGPPRQGIRLLEPLVASTERGPEALNALGIAYARAGRHDDARRVFERVLTVDPGSSVPLENLGMLALERGDLATARTRTSRRRSRVDPRSSRAHAGRRIGRAAAGKPRGGDRGVDASRAARTAKLRRAVQPCRHPRARRSRGRAAVSRTVSENRATGTLREGSGRGRAAVEPLAGVVHFRFLGGPVQATKPGPTTITKRRERP